MIAAITAALVVVAALGVSFRATRHSGIAAFAALCFLYPWLSVFVILAIVWAWWRMKR